MKEAILCQLILIFNFACLNAHEFNAQFFSYPGHAIVCALPKNTIIFIDTNEEQSREGKIYKYLDEKIRTKDQNALNLFLERLIRFADQINSGDIHDRQKAIESFASKLDDLSENALNFSYCISSNLPMQIEDISLTPLFETVDEKNKKEIAVAALQAKNVLEEKGWSLDEIAEAFKMCNSKHFIFTQPDWFDYALACYFFKKITDEEIAALGVLSTLIAFPQPLTIEGIDIFLLDTPEGRALFSFFYNGRLKQKEIDEAYQELVLSIKHKSPIEKLIFRIRSNQISTMKRFNGYVLKGACYQERENNDNIVDLMPFAFHKLLQILFGDNVTELQSCFGYSEQFKDWCHDKRPISIPCPRIPILSRVHNQLPFHLMEALVHDAAHQILCAQIPREHRSAFRKIAAFLQAHLQNAEIDEIFAKKIHSINALLLDMPFSSYLEMPSKLAFYVSLAISIYRSVFSNWETVFTVELVSYVHNLIKMHPSLSEKDFLKNCDMYLNEPTFSEKLRKELTDGCKWIHQLKILMQNAINTINEI